MPALRIRALQVTCAALLACGGGVAAAQGIEYRSTAAAAVLYDSPSVQGQRQFILAADTPVEVVVVLERWVKVREPAGAIAWIEAGRLAARRTVIVTAERATAFQNADAGSAVAFHATRDVVLELTQPAAGGWVGVRHRDGASGFLRVTEVWGL